MKYTVRTGVLVPYVQKFKKQLILAVAALFVASIASMTLGARAAVNEVTPSTNVINEANGWAHVNVVSADTEQITLEFVNPRGHASCFEYRTDGDTTQVSGSPNYNTAVLDGLYPFKCVNNGTDQVTLEPDQYVEVRMVFGAESDERFDWTRFDLLYDRQAEITAPTAGETVSGVVDFTAYLNDDDADNIQWAVREGTCDMVAASNIFGNVTGVNDVATINQSNLSNQTFEFTGDMSGLADGMYCFIYNPVEDTGEADIRLTSEFTLDNPQVLSSKDQCKKGGWENATADGYDGTFKNQGHCVSHFASNHKSTNARNR